MNNITDEEFVRDDYDILYQNIINHIETTNNNIEIIKEKAILEIYWNLGETLIEMGHISDQELKNLRDHVNSEIRIDPLLHHEETNTHWLKLAKLWVTEHQHHDKKILLSGYVTWTQWALLLDVVKSAPQRYWLACQTIKQRWDISTLLRAALSLPSEHLNR